MESLSPNIFVSDISATIAFYQNLGFSLTAQVPDQGDPVWAMMNSGQVNMMFQSFKSIEGMLPVVSRTNGGSLLLYIRITGIRAFFEKVKDKAEVLSGLEKTFYGATEFSIRDVNNYMLTFAEDE